MAKGDQTRRRIVELAAPLFNQKGYEGCSMADVMEATGLEKGGIYRYFKSKEELAAEAFRYSLNQVRERRTGDIDHVSGSLNKLRAFIDRFVSEPSPIKGGCPLANTALDTDDGNELLRTLAREAFTQWRKRMAEVVRQGISDGEIQTSCPPAELADTIIATLEGALLISRLDGSRTALKHARQSLEKLLESHAVPKVN